MNSFDFEEIDLNKIIGLVKRSKFFKLKRGIKINESLLRQINLDSINLPLKLKFTLKKQNIFTLEELLNTETKSLLRLRNIGDKTISKARKIIIDYLIRIRDSISNTQSIKNPDVFDDDTLFVGKYFPLLKGTFITNKIFYNSVYQNCSCIKLPKSIKEYITNDKTVKLICDLLNTSCDELIKAPNIGNKTVGKLQTQIIEYLNLKKVIFIDV